MHTHADPFNCHAHKRAPSFSHPSPREPFSYTQAPVYDPAHQHLCTRTPLATHPRPQTCLRTRTCTSKDTHIHASTHAHIHARPEGAPVHALRVQGRLHGQRCQRFLQTHTQPLIRVAPVPAHPHIKAGRIRPCKQAQQACVLPTCTHVCVCVRVHVYACKCMCDHFEVGCSRACR